MQTSVSTTPAVGVPGLLGTSQSALHATTRSKTSEEASASIGFGLMVQQGTADDGALLLTATTNKLVGVSVFAQNYVRGSDGAEGQLDDDGLRPGVNFAVCEVGEIWVLPEAAVTPASEVHVRAVATGDELAGAFRATADGTDTIDITPYARWLTTGSSTVPALLQIDLRNAALGVADT